MLPQAPDQTTTYISTGVHPTCRLSAKYTVRLWSVRNARLLEWVYNNLADALLKLHWLWNWIGYHRVERPVIVIEKWAKSFLFDCRMCGQCALSETGMSCPMNCEAIAQWPLRRSTDQWQL
jgi:hypothetical protein